MRRAARRLGRSGRPARDPVDGGARARSHSARDTELLLKSRRVVPGRLLDAGFTFEYAEWPEAATDLVRRVRERAGTRADTRVRPSATGAGAEGR